MKFYEAFDETLYRGTKIRRKNWADNEFIYFNKRFYGFISHLGVFLGVISYSSLKKLNAEDAEDAEDSDDWEIYIDPKKLTLENASFRGIEFLIENG